MKPIYTLAGALAFTMLSHSTVSAQEAPLSDSLLVKAKDIFDMSLEELMSLEIVTASNVSEKLNKAPATIIVITEQDIQDRGYMEMYDILQDLPGFDLSRAFGDDNYYLYARGYRKETSDQMLLMVDGIIMNHLFNNNMNAFLQYPMYNIKQVEVVYGPASAVYGPNAFAGVINVITKKEGSSTVFASVGKNKSNLIDLNISQKKDDLTINLTGRLYATAGHDFGNKLPFLSNKMYGDTAMWGPLSKTDFFGKYSSPIRTQYMGASVQYKGLTIGTINWFSESGYGSEYPSDKVQPAATWQFDEQTYYAKYETQVGKLTSRSLFRIRQSGLPNGSAFVERYSNGVDVSYWENTNKGTSFFQDFSMAARSNVFLNFGFKYDRRVLQKGYVENYGPFIGDSVVLAGPYPFPSLPTHGNTTQHNHYIMEDRGVYMQAKWTAANGLDVYGGIRYDNNTIWKDIVSPRVGVVYEIMPNLVAKAFYGTAFLEPTPRVLYGGWKGSLSNSNLKPEKMRTFETSLTYTSGQFSNGVNFYYNTGFDAIGNNAKKQPENIGKRQMMGIEFYSKYLMNTAFGVLSKLRIDAFVSYLESKEDLKNTGDFTATGNMSPIKVRLMATAYFGDNLSISLQNRFNSVTETVATNPIKEIDSWFVTDMNITYRNLLVKGLSAGLKIYNVFDADYYHAGYRDAGAGEVAVDAAGNHVESKSWYNSRLPQPARNAHIFLRFDF